MTPSLAHHRRRPLGVLFSALALLLSSSWATAAAPVIEWSASGYAVAENAGTLAVRVVRTGDLAGTSLVTFASTNGTAADGVDFTGVSGVLTFLPGETNYVLNIPLLDNASAQSGRFFQLRLSALSNALPGLQTNATVTVLDDENTGTLDPWFDAGVGAGDDVFALGLTPGGRILVGGQFTSFNNVPGRNYLAVLQPDGVVDASFNFADIALNGAVYAVGSAADDSLFLGGDFNLVVKLKPGGGLDTNFPNVSVNNSLRALLVQPDGKIIIAGRFTKVAGQTRNRIARLNSDGSLDASFTGNGANGNVRALALQPDGKILVGGSFSTLDSYTRRNIGRLQTNGLLDLTFDPGSGADGQVRSVAVQADGKILLGGDFAQYDGYVHSGVARAQANGPADNDFDSGETPGTSIRAVALAPDGQVWIGGSFTFAGGADRYYLARLGTNGAADSFRADAGFEVNTILVQPDGQTLVAGDFGSIMGLSAGRIARLNTGTLLMPGPQIQLTASNLFVNETAGQTAVTVTRRGDYAGAAQVDFTTRQGSAIAGADYTSAIGTLAFAPQETAKILALSVLILNDRRPETDETFFLALTNATAPATLVGVSNLTVTIASDDTGFEFTADTYATSEPVGLATIGVRLQATGEGAVSVDFRVVTGTATAGTDFLATNGTLIFQPGETQKTFTVTILADALTEGIETAHLLLTNAGPGSALGARTNAPLSIDDVDSTIQWAYATLPYESEGSLSAVIRRSGTLTLPATVDWFTTDGTATAGLDYVSASGTAIFQTGQVSAYVGVTLLNDGLVEGTETIYFDLSNASSGSKLGVNTNVFASVLDNDAGMAFVETNVIVSEHSAFVVLPVRRHDDGTGPLSVEYFASDGTALSGVNYGAPMGTLHFPTNTHLAALKIPLIDQCGLTNARQFIVALRNPSAGGALGVDTQAVVTVHGNDAAGQRDQSFIGGQPANFVAVMPNRRIATLYYSPTLLEADGQIVSDFSFPFPDQFYLVIANTALAADRNGNLLMAGTSSAFPSWDITPWLFRVLPSGQMDNGFVISTRFTSPISDYERLGVADLLVQPDGRILSARDAYTRIPETAPKHAGIYRMLPDGPRDPDFQPGTGAEFSETGAGARALGLQPDGKILLGGVFTNFSGQLCPGLIRLETNGAIDPAFAPAVALLDGSEASQFSTSQIKAQPDGSILVLGNFTQVGGAPRASLVRLQPNGSMDSTFDPGIIMGGSIKKILLQPNGRIVIGGSFTNVQGHARFGLARLNSDGSLDQTFDPAPDQYDVTALALQPDGRILVSDASTGLWRVEGDPVPRVRELSRTNGVAHLRLASRPGKTYALEASTNLVNWLPLQTNTAADCALEFFDASSPPTHRFYRAVQLSP